MGFPQTAIPTVLLIDASRDDREMYAEYLRRCGLRPVEIEEASEALTLARDAAAVVTGVRVPGPFDGIELVRRLRANRQTADMPVILLTACAFEEDRQRALEAGCDVFLIKPCLPDVLFREIERLLGAPRKVLRARPRALKASLKPHKAPGQSRGLRSRPRTR